MSAPMLEPGLSAFARRAARRTAAAAAARAAVLVPAALLAAALIDALRPMPAWLRAAAAASVAAATAAGFVRAITASRRAWPGAPAAARETEARATLAGNPLITALQLGRPAAVGDPITSALVARAVARGESAWASVDHAVVLRPESRQTRAAGTMLLLALAVLTGAWAAAPRMLSAAATRFLEPWADHPPWSPTDFVLSIRPAQPVIGDDVSVRVETTRRQPRSLRLVVRAGGDERTLALDRRDDGTDPSRRVYVGVLRRLREPARVHALADTGRSRSILITPAAEPRIVESVLRIVPPGYTGRPATVRAGAAGPLGEFDAVAGSEITLRVGTTLPLREDGVEVNPGGGARTTAAGRGISARWRATRSGSYELSIRPVGETGVASRDRASAVITVRDDQPPTLSLNKPPWRGADLLAPPHALLIFDAAATDDLGLSVLGLAWSKIDSTGAWVDFGERMDVRRDGPPRVLDGRTTARFVARLDLPALGVRAGDTLLISLLARDTRPESFGGGQEAAVGPIAVRIAGGAEGGACSGRCEGWIVVPSVGGEDGENLNGSALSTWTSDGEEAARDAGRGSPRGQAWRATAQEQRVSEESGDGADAAGDAENERSEQVRAVSTAALRPDDLADAAPPPAIASGAEHLFDPGRAPGSSAFTRSGGWLRLPSAYRDLAARYFMILNRHDHGRARD